MEAPTAEDANRGVLAFAFLSAGVFFTLAIGRYELNYAAIIFAFMIGCALGWFSHAILFVSELLAIVRDQVNNQSDDWWKKGDPPPFEVDYED